MDDTAAAAIAEKVAEEKSEGAPDTFTASNGVVLHLQKVSYNLSVEASRRIPEPEPPTVYLEDRDREEVNYDDPKYVAAVLQRTRDIGDVTNMLYLTLGVSSIDVPQGIEHWEGQGWSDAIQDASNGLIDIPASGVKRRTLWLKYIALAASPDFFGAIEAIGRYSSSAVSMRDVEDVLDSFRSEEERHENNGANPTE